MNESQLHRTDYLTELSSSPRYHRFADAMLTRAKQTTGAPALSEALDFSMTLLEKHAAKSQA